MTNFEIYYYKKLKVKFVKIERVFFARNALFEAASRFYFQRIIVAFKSARNNQQVAYKKNNIF